MSKNRFRIQVSDNYHGGQVCGSLCDFHEQIPMESCMIRRAIKDLGTMQRPGPKCPGDGFYKVQLFKIKAEK